ncbi:MAG: hypothetical protein KGI10_03935 [Thaumarchaeota archaeon]|nr:hypothetical protein [Nitrososphaerota archaeon]
MVDLIQLDPRDILQANVTIIAGILVLLTISGVLEARLTKKLWEELRGLIGMSPIFFASSVVLLLSPSFLPITNVVAVMTLSKLTLACGLGYITVCIGYVMIISKPKDDGKKSEDEIS